MPIVLVFDFEIHFKLLHLYIAYLCIHDNIYNNQKITVGYSVPQYVFISW